MRAVGDAQRAARARGAEAAVDVVVLAVDVGGDHAAERHELRARRDRREEAARQEEPVDLAQREPGLGAQHAGRRVEGEDAVGERRAGDLAIARRRQRRVAVGAAEAAA